MLRALGYFSYFSSISASRDIHIIYSCSPSDTIQKPFSIPSQTTTATTGSTHTTPPILRQHNIRRSDI